MAAGSATILDERVTASAELLRRRPGGAKLLVHALAQLPDRVSLSLPEDVPARPTLELLARAYSIEDRLMFERGAPSGPVDELLAAGASLGEIVDALSSDDDPPASLRRDDSVLSGHRVAVVTNLPTHYRT